MKQHKPMRQMVSMELDDESKMDANMPIPMPSKPDYPYGLRLCLENEQFEKLALDPTEACVGGMVHGHFMARITSVSADKNQDGTRNRVELQIESLNIESEDDEN